VPELALSCPEGDADDSALGADGTAETATSAGAPDSRAAA